MERVVTIRLCHKSAQQFFRKAMHPDIEELKRRDDFIEEFLGEYQVYTDGTDFVIEIPDVDVTSMMEESNGY